jgi:SEC-C motif
VEGRERPSRAPGRPPIAECGRARISRRAVAGVCCTLAAVDETPAAKDPLELLAHPPADRYSLLELSVEWDGLEDIRSRFAAALRVFVITKYPLDWLGDRDLAWVIANADGDTLELPLYVALEEIQRRLQSTDGDLPSAIAPLAERVVVAAADNQGIVLAGAYADMAFRGEISGLLDSDVGEEDPRLSLAIPRVSVRSDGWEPIGLGAIQDLVQDAFGPVDLDRSLVALPPTKAPRAGCPACAGRRFGFPADLAQAVPAMCAEHQAAAHRITESRIRRARTSNIAGMRAIALGSARVSGGPDPGGGFPIPQRRRTDPGRNDPCPCGSGRKYKNCCGR